MKLFLTGGTGFIGAHFVNAAHRAGHDIVALRRPGGQPRISLDRAPEWIEGALDGEFGPQLRGCDTLVHLAAHSVSAPYDTLANCLYWNLTASLALFEQALHVGITRFLVAGTSYEYGRSSERYRFIPVDAPLEPVASYPTSKAAASTAFYGWAAEHKILLTILRVFHAFGVGEPETRLWPSLRRAALTGADFPMSCGEQARDFIPVERVAEAFVEALAFQNVRAGYPCVQNVGTGEEQTLLQFARKWWDTWQAKGKLIPGAIDYRDNEIMRCVPDLG